MYVELINQHIHAGKSYSPGEIIDLDDATAQWLIEYGVARPVEPTTKNSDQDQ